MYLIFIKYFGFSSLSECEKSKKFSSTPSELNLNCVSTPSELVISEYSIVSSLSVLIIENYKNRKEGIKRELTI